MTRRPVAFAVLTSSLLIVSACVPEVDKFFSEKRLNRLAIPRDDISPGTLVIHKDGVAQSTDNILEVAPNASLTVSAFDAILPGIDRTKAIDASLGLKAVDAILPLGFDAALKLTNSVKIPQASMAGLKVSSTQIGTLLTTPAGAPLKKWILDRAARKIGTFVVMQTYRAKEFSMVAESGKDITTDLTVGETKLVQKGEAKFLVKRTSKEQLSISGEKYYVVAVSVAAFDIAKEGKSITIGPLGVDLSLPVPKVPVLGGTTTAPSSLFRPVGLQPASDR
jgi:hypothetical protein